MKSEVVTIDVVSLEKPLKVRALPIFLTPTYLLCPERLHLC